MPLISVIMSVRNGERYLRQALDSILNQSFKDFEFIVIDDASTDNTAEILKAYEEQDSRFRIIQNEQNLGLGENLARAVNLAEGEFIARMDADDISMPERLKVQSDFLLNQPEILVCGSDFEIIDADGFPKNKISVIKNLDILRWRLLLGSGMLVNHGIAMFRRSFFDKFGNYSSLRTAQDFELWSRLFKEQPLPIANLDFCLLQYRIHQEAITTLAKPEQEENAINIRLKTISELLSTEVEKEVLIAYRYPSLQYEDIGRQIEKWIEIYLKFVDKFQPDEESVKSIQLEMIERFNKYSRLPFQKKSPFRVSFNSILRKLPPSFRRLFIKEKLLWTLKRL